MRGRQGTNPPAIARGAWLWSGRRNFETVLTCADELLNKI